VSRWARVRIPTAGDESGLARRVAIGIGIGIGIGIEVSMTPKARALLAAATLFGFAAVVLSLKLIGGPATSGPQSVRSSTVTPPTTRITVFPAESPPAGVSKPPLVLLPDKFGATCGTGITLPARQGWPTRAGRGTPETACAFSVNVLEAYRLLNFKGAVVISLS
jgi:hypothetical protein